MRKTILTALTILTGLTCAYGAQRELTETRKVELGQSKKEALKFFQAESITLTGTYTQNGRPVDLSATNLIVVWEINGWSDYTNTYAISTGTVASASNTVQFSLAPIQSNLASSNYLGFVRALQSDGTNLAEIAVLSYQTIAVDWSPDSRNYNLVGPITAPAYYPASVITNLIERIETLEQQLVYAPVVSVNGQTGVVTITAASIGAATGTPVYVEQDTDATEKVYGLGVSTTQSFAGVVADIQTEANLSNAYYIIEGHKFVYNAYGQDPTKSAWADEIYPSNWVEWYSSQYGTMWVMDFEGNEYTNPENSYLPPVSGWRQTTQGGPAVPTNLNIRFIPGSVALEEAARNDAVSNLWPAVSNRVSSIVYTTNSVGSSYITNGVLYLGTNVPAGGGLTTNDIVQTAGTNTATVPSSALLNSSLAGKASSTNLTERSVQITNRITIAGAGQSNMDGYPAGYGMLPDESISGITNCFYSHYGQYTTVDTNKWDYTGILKKIDTHSSSIISWGIELPVVKSLRDQMPDTQFYFLKSAVGSSSITSWTNGGSFWKYLTNAWAQSQSAWTNPAPKYFVWMQGESNSSAGQTNNYLAYQQTLISDVRTFYNNTNMIVILAGLPKYYYTNGFGATIEEAKIAAAASGTNVYYVQMYDIPEPTAHYNQTNLFIVAGRISELIYSLEAERDYSNPVHSKRITAESGCVEGTLDAGQITQNGVPLAEVVRKISSGMDYPIPVSRQALTGVTARFKPYDSTDLGLSTNTLVVDVPEIGFESGKVGGYLRVTAEDDVVGIPKSLDSAWTNSDFTVFIRVRPQYDIGTDGPVSTWSWYCYSPNTTNKAPTLTSRNYFNNGDPSALRQQLTMYPESNPTGETFIMRNALESNVWHSIAFTVARTSKVVTAYFDGEIDTQWTSSSTNAWTTSWFSPTLLTSIGGRYSTGTSSQFSQCDFSDFVCIPRVLTAYEIWCLENGQSVEGE